MTVPVFNYLYKILTVWGYLPGTEAICDCEDNYGEKSDP